MSWCGAALRPRPSARRNSPPNRLLSSPLPGNVGPLLRVSALALLAMAATLPHTSLAERGLAIAGILCVARLRLPWAWLLLALAVGCTASLRVREELREARALDGYEGVAQIALTQELRGDQIRGFVRAEDGREGWAWFSGPELRPGMAAAADLRLRLPPNRRNFDDRGRWRAGLASGAVLRGRVQSVHGSREQPVGLARLRGRLVAALERNLKGSASLWRALLLADRGGFPDGFLDALQRLGLAHLVALSGMHVGLVVGAAVLAGRRRRPSPGILLVLALWVALAGGGASLLRAAIMVGWILVGRRLQRQSDASEAIAFAAWVELCLWPWRIAGVGWWLSYGATLSLVRSQRWLRELPRPLGLLALSSVAQAGGAPWALASFGRWPWIAALSNLTLGLTFAPFLLLGFFFLGIGSLLPWIRDASYALVQLATHCFCWLLLRAAELSPEPWGHPGIGGAHWGLALTAWGAALLPLARWPLRAALLLLCLLIPHLPLLAGRGASWWSLDVGQGDAGVYRSAEGRWLVVDLGPAFEEYSAAEFVVGPFLQRRNARGVELILSHGHLDHYGAASALLAKGMFSRVHVARADSGVAWTSRLMDAAERGGCDWSWVARGDSISLGRERIPVLWPPADAGALSTNDRSLVLRVGPQHAPLLLTGDAEAEAERELLEGGALGHAKILKLGHHGSKTSTGEAWLGRIAPADGIVSCAAVNRYGHPDPGTLERLGGLGIRAWRTDRQGAIRVRWNAAGYVVESVR